jgi:uncharacterized membrane protein YgdD (TMEM256/DUF423 family)
VTRVFLVVAAVAGAAGIAADAATAHGVAPDVRRLVGIGADYLIVHALAFLALAALAAVRPGKLWAVPAVLWMLGMAGFSGGLILRGFTGISLGPLVPVGGGAYILGWLSLTVPAIAARR